MQPKGKVFLVGAGPGDPDLLTVKACRLLQQAEVVVYDRLVSAAVMDLVPPGVTRISVGKASGHHPMPQHEINRLLADLAASGHRVVRLKGGDPFVFGRGSEEAMYLRDRDLEFEVVPGITAAAACTAYAGIPLTHRGLSHGVQLVTGHLGNDGQLDLDWQRLADPGLTLVIYMGLANIGYIRDRLIAAGLAGDTPAAAIENGTQESQRRLLTELRQLPERIEELGLRPPSLIVIGRTAALGERLDWFRPQLEEHCESPRLLALG